jgi:hypothetical protein
VELGIRLVMRQRATPSRVYDVRIDRENVVQQVLGHDRKRFVVALLGGVDDHWRQAYRAAQLDSTDLFRYRLDLETNTVGFVGQGRVGDVMFRLDRLSNLVALVNRRASS